MKVYLVRHAIAVERGSGEFQHNDDKRPLTPEGEARFRRVVRGLAAIDVRVAVIITSPLVRARQTAELLSDGLPDRPPVHESRSLEPGQSPAAVVDDLLGRDGLDTVALVGHEPGIGQLAAYLVGARRPLSFKKGGVCRIDFDAQVGSAAGDLQWFAPPRLLRRVW